MKFGKEFKIHLEETLPEWRDKFLCYKPLKKLLKHFPLSPEEDRSRLDTLLLRHPDYFPQRQVVVPPGGPQPPLLVLQDWFLRILNEELEKFNDFYVDKEEEFVIRLQELRMRIEGLKEKSSKDGVFSSESEFSEEMMDIRKNLVTIHGEMVLLKNYSSLNFAGLVKILKKYDKRTGGLLRLPFTQLVLHQPFFTTEPLTMLVHECEANLELLFPLEAEVVQSSSPAKPLSNQLSTDMTDVSHESSSLDNQTIEIYRSTLAAMKAIKGLQKASSTQNPLSFSSIFKSQDDDISGGVVTDHSASNSPASMQDAEEGDQKVVHSE